MVRSNRWISLILLACLALSLAVPSLLVHAQDLGTPELLDEPAIYFAPSDQESSSLNAELSPGETTTFSVDIGSLEGIPFEAVTYAANAVTLRNGGYGMLGRDSEKSGATTWLDFPTQFLGLTPGEVFQQEFSVTVPMDATPGEYVTGVAVETADPVGQRDPDAAYQYDVYLRTVIGIRIIVPGDLKAEITLGSPAFVADGTAIALSIPISNVGNLSAAPELSVSVTNQAGESVISAQFMMGRVYSGHDTEIFLPLSSSVPPGEYALEVTLVDEPRDVSVSLFAESVILDERLYSPPEQRIVAASVVPAPAEGEVVYLEIGVELTNEGEAISSGQLTLVAKKDGEEVERYVLAETVVLDTGNRAISTRYIPSDGFSSGNWTFELHLETVDGSGTSVLLDSVEVNFELDVP